MRLFHDSLPREDNEIKAVSRNASADAEAQEKITLVPVAKRLATGCQECIHVLSQVSTLLAGKTFQTNRDSGSTEFRQTIAKNIVSGPIACQYRDLKNLLPGCPGRKRHDGVWSTTGPRMVKTGGRRRMRVW